MSRRLLAFFAIFLAFSFTYAERVVKIESARTSEYIKGKEVPSDGQDAPKTDKESDKETATEVIVFRGDVLISVTDGGSVSAIGADEIIYDKTQDTLEARGNVTYKHTSGKSGTQEFRGNALLFNIEKQEGVFLDGIVTQDTGDKKSDPYVIHAEVSGRNSGSTMAFKNGILTTCNAEEPHWSINASRIWMLPGNEIALLNGVFYIGPLPVFYLPFFYYPSDEMIFHPVFGFRSREGNFLQTSTYLLGRKPLVSSSSSSSSSKDKDKKTFSNFLQNSTLKKQEGNGLFLMNLEEDAQDVSGNYLKVLGDAYSNLGYMTGIDGNYTSSGLIKSFSGSAYLGFSKTVYQLSSGSFYTTFDATGKENWNSSSFFGISVPFRYRFNFSVQIDKAPLQFTLTMPFVSDKMFKTDFLDRSEDLNWFDTLTKSGKTEEDTVTAETSYSWTANGSFTPDVSFAKPWITSLSVSGLSASMTFNSKQNTSYTGDEAAYAPDNYFFYPEILKPEIRVSLGGTILTSDRTQATASDSKKKPDLGSLTNPFAPVKEEVSKKDDNAKDDKSISATTPPIPASGIGAQTTSVNSKKIAYSLTWSLQPTYVQEMRYDTSLWVKPSDIKWNQFSSVYYQIKGIAALNGSFSYDSNLFSLTTALNFTGTKQDHPLLSGTSYATTTQREEVFTSDYKASIFDLKTTDAIKFAPLIHDELLKPFAITWNYTGILLKNEFTGTIAKPDWQIKTPEWTDDFVSVHNAALITGVSLG
ncbi:MAG TPA: LPS-assembly protein LptD, partial [Treponemataceae bacterium]|nr:LPS-assembly protein LptD [Treponemataceae bacterium]